LGWEVQAPVKQEENRINKIKHFFKVANAPKHLHRFGPKTYNLWQHVFALFIKEESQLSYRRTTRLLREFGFKVATKSTLQRYSERLNMPFWQKIYNQTISDVSDIVSIDGTGLERTKVSQYYVKRFDSNKRVDRGYHFGIIVGEDSKILSLRLRKKYSHDIKDARYLFEHLPQKPKIILMDKGYDSEKLHRYFADRNVWSIAPVKKNYSKGKLRKKLKDNFPQNLYNKRPRVESVFHSFKQKYGSSIRSRNIGPARTEIYCRAILYNLSLKLARLLGHILFFE